jgi:chaperone BCS1
LASKYQAGEQFRQFYVPHTITKKNLQEPGIVLSEKQKSQNLTTDQDEDGSPSTDPLAEKNHVEDKDHHLHLDDLDSEEFTTRINRLADQFAEDFPEYVISSASLQQYLLMYKSDPIEAVANFKTWVQAEIERKDSKERSKQLEGREAALPESQPPDSKLPPSDGNATTSTNGVRVSD